MKNSRRSFIKKVAVGSSALALGSVAYGFSADSYGRIKGANDRIRIGIMGTNGRGKGMAANTNRVGNQYFSNNSAKKLSMNSNLPKMLFLTFTMLSFVQCRNTEHQKESRSAEPGKRIVMFDGSSTEHWRDTKSREFPEQGWKVDGIILTVLGETQKQQGGHDIITKQKFSNFELVLEAKLSEGANSGIKYNVSDSFPGNEGKFLGPEFQLLDNDRHPDAINGRDGNHKMASLYDLIPPPATLKNNPPGEWNKVRIILDGRKVEHWLNDEKVLQYDRKSEEFTRLVDKSKYKDLQYFGALDSGYILLQGHGNEVSFRNITIRSW